MPRPTRLRARRFWAGLSDEREMSSGISCLLRFLGADEMANPAQHTGELRRLGMLGRAADLAEAEGAQRAPVARALTDLALHLGNANLRHCSRSAGSSPVSPASPCAVATGDPSVSSSASPPASTDCGVAGGAAS